MKPVFAEIEIIGCDDETSLKIGLTQEQFDFLAKISTLISAESKCACQPIMRIKELAPIIKKE